MKTAPRRTQIPIARAALTEPERRALSRRVIIADDDAHMRWMLRLWLERRGFAVEESADGIELVERLASDAAAGATPDAVVSDIQMPGRDGLEALSEIRGTYPEIPVVLITAYGDHATHRRARELGANAIIDKPLNPAKLTETLIELTGSP